MPVGDRSLFPDLRWRIYANHASIGPLSSPVRDAVRAVVDGQAIEGVGVMPGAIARLHDARTGLAQLLGVDADGVALLGSTSDAVVAAAQTIPWRPGDRILLFEGEFPTNTTPWQIAADQHGLQVVWETLDGFDDGSGDGLARVARHLADGVRVVAVSAVQFQTGLRMPVEALADLTAAHDAWLAVDAIQGAGIVPLDLSGADVVATGGQKWLMAPVGTGALAVRPDRFTEVRPTLASWLSHTDPLRFLFEGPGALTYDRPLATGHALYEGGSRNLAGHAGLAAATAVALEVGVDTAYRHAQAWIDAAEDGLLARGFRSVRATDPAARSAILSVVPPDGHTPTSLAEGLGARGISVATPDGHLRLSPSWPNALDEVGHVLDALDEVMA